VTLRDAAGSVVAATVTGGDGRFTLTDVPEGRYVLAVAPLAGYLGATVTVDVPVAGNQPLTISLVAAAAPGPPMNQELPATGYADGQTTVVLAAGLHRTTPASVSLLLNVEVVFTGVIAALFFGENLGRRVAIGTALVFAAGATLGWSGNPDLRLGSLLVAGACLCWGLDNCITAKLDQVTPAQITMAKGAIAGGVNLVLGLVLEATPPLRSTVAVMLIGAFGYGASITLWLTGARELGAARGQLVFASAPFVGVAVSWTALAQPVAGREWSHCSSVRSASGSSCGAATSTYIGTIRSNMCMRTVTTTVITITRISTVATSVRARCTSIGTGTWGWCTPTRTCPISITGTGTDAIERGSWWASRACG
jgi:hypothetical protein